jgi:TatD DNase family protein
MPEFFDTHAHLDFPDFAADLPQVIERAESAGIKRIITIGTDADSSARAIALAEGHPSIFAAIGWHPTHVSSAPADIRPMLRKLAAHPKVVAIGETGLDYHRLPAPEEVERYKTRQAEVFEQQLEIAAEMGMNCIIHQRDSFEDTLKQMEPWAGKVRGVFHCFGGDVAAMQRVMAMGSLVSFTGIITFKNAQTVRETVAATPIDRFMLETDCPFLAPAPHRGKRCEPAYVREIAGTSAEVRKCSLEELSRATCATAKTFFPKLNQC